jgi:predicted dienelactone hydrolase
MTRARFILLSSTLALAVACSVTPSRRSTPVGRLQRRYADSARTDWDGRGPRPLVATIWYPAAAGSEEAEWQGGVFRFGHSARDAAFADAARRPLIVLSHGTGGSAAQLSWLAEALAAHGFVVAGVNHHGNTAAEDRYWPAGFVLPWERARDLSVLIDRLAADSVVGPHVDTTRLGAAGFSLGGYSVLALAGARLSFRDWRHRCAARPDAPGCALPPEATFTLGDVDSLARTDAPFRAGVARGEQPTYDPRVQAVYAMAPALVSALDTASLAAIRLPVRVVLGGADTQVPPGPTAVALARVLPGAGVETRAGVAHYSFLAPCTWRGRLFVRALCADGGAARVALHDSVALDVVRFFTQQLRPASPGGERDRAVQ